jgi:hypothetical protein
MPLPPVYAELRASTGEFMAKMGEAKAAMEDVGDTGTSKFTKLQTAAEVRAPRRWGARSRPTRSRSTPLARR